MRVTFTLDLPERLAVHFKSDTHACAALRAYMENSLSVDIVRWAESYLCKDSVEQTSVTFEVTP